MTEFCKCGSLMIGGNCTNKKCSFHKASLVDPASYAQTQYIKSLMKQLGDDREVDFNTLTKPEAKTLIDELILKKETGE